MSEITVHRVRKYLNKNIAQLSDIVADLDLIVTKLGYEYFRVCIFGSARIKPDSKEYKIAESLAFSLGLHNVDIVTGGGPGLMEAANLGAKKARRQGRSIGLAIELPFEADANQHLDVKYHHRRFSSRLDEFMRLSHAVVVTAGGIGTLLELFYTWQLLQVNHINERPLILIGKDMWGGLLDWMKDQPLERKLVDQSDLDKVILVDTVEEVMAILEPHIQSFQKNLVTRLEPSNK
jgi:uncharacterized protein (TIGR00730 family)